MRKVLASAPKVLSRYEAAKDENKRRLESIIAAAAFSAKVVADHKVETASGHDLVIMGQIAQNFNLGVADWYAASDPSKQSGMQSLLDCLYAQRDFEDKIDELQNKLLAQAACLVASLWDGRTCSAEAGDVSVAQNDVSKALRDREFFCAPDGGPYGSGAWADLLT